MTVRWLVMTLGIIVTGCAASRSERTAGAVVHPSERLPRAVAPAPVKDTEGYNYELLRREDTQLVEVFDDTHTTYLKFAREVPAGLLLFDERGRVVPFTVRERMVVADGVRLGVLVRTPTRSSYAQAPKSDVVARLGVNGASEEAGPPRLPVAAAAARAEILGAEGRLRGLMVELDRASRGEPLVPMSSVRAEIEEIQTTLDGVDATLVRAHFTSGSALLVLSAEARRAILNAAARADQIRVIGGTDNAGKPQANEFLAHRRAVSMRQVLIAGGIAASKVRLDHAAPVYVSSNATAAGQAENRRVDVVFGRNQERNLPVAQENSRKAETNSTVR